MTTATISLDVHICDQARSYTARFATDAQAAAFITGRALTHAFAEIPGQPLPETAVLTAAALYPTCEHGMSAALCSGPGHYPADDRYVYTGATTADAHAAWHLANGWRSGCPLDCAAAEWAMWDEEDVA